MISWIWSISSGVAFERQEIMKSKLCHDINSSIYKWKKMAHKKRKKKKNRQVTILTLSEISNIIKNLV